MNKKEKRIFNILILTVIMFLIIAFSEAPIITNNFPYFVIAGVIIVIAEINMVKKYIKHIWIVKEFLKWIRLKY